MPERLAHHQAEGRARVESRVRGGPRPVAPTAPGTAGQLLRLQRSFGNRAVWSLLARPPGPVHLTAGDVSVRLVPLDSPVIRGRKGSPKSGQGHDQMRRPNLWQRIGPPTR
jgi:hypothetical protein